MPADKSHIGLTGQPVSMHVELGKIREFARAIHDADLPGGGPGDTLATGNVIPPVTFLMTVALWDDGRGRPDVPLDRRRVLHGEQEFEYLRSVHAGDRLTAVTTVTDVYDKPGRRGGAMTFVATETEFTDASGAVVARSRSVRIETGEGPRP